jgi:hypothetical protein
MWFFLFSSCAESKGTVVFVFLFPLINSDKNLQRLLDKQKKKLVKRDETEE